MRQRAIAVSIGRPETEASRLARRTTSPRSARYVLETGDKDYLFTLGLRAARAELRCGPACIFEGIFGVGTAHITGPSRRIAVAVQGPHDLLQLRIPQVLLQARLASISAKAAYRDLDGRTVQDPLVGQLGRLLPDPGAERDSAYEEAVIYTLLTQILRLTQDCQQASALPKWRLRRVQTLVEQNLVRPLTLRDMAAAAGLSRMHFAAQFKAATGCSPHHYLLCQRVEAAKMLLSGTDLPLVEIALDVGFSAQAHFTTVFKRLVGETPARWRRSHRDISLAPV